MTEQLPCPAPVFFFNELRGWYEACTSCGRTAWEHEQSDPMADVLAHVDWIRRRGDEAGERPPYPAMRGA